MMLMVTKRNRILLCTLNQLNHLTTTTINLQWTISKGCPYKVLGLKEGVSFEEVKKKYLELCFKLHPDRSQVIKDKGELTDVIMAYQFIRKHPSYKMNKKISPSTVYKAGPYQHSYHVYQKTMKNNKPIYGPNAQVVKIILLFCFLGLLIQYWRFYKVHGSVMDMREKHFKLSAMAYYQVLELANKLGTKDRIKLFLDEYGRRNK